jgi:hypothetical protein
VRIFHVMPFIGRWRNSHLEFRRERHKFPPRSWQTEYAERSSAINSTLVAGS